MDKSERFDPEEIAGGLERIASGRPCTDRTYFGNDTRQKWRRDHQETTALCRVCGARPGFMATHCPGSSTYGNVDVAVGAGFADFIDGEWITDPLLLLSMRTSRQRSTE